MRHLAIVAALLAPPAMAQTYEDLPVVDGYELSAIDTVWSGHEVQFAVVEGADRVFVGYYDANRQLTIASRPKDGQYWSYAKLDTWTGWDSHNYVAMGLDDAGQLHIAANMHNDRLRYWKTTRAGDVASAERVPVLVDEGLEASMTYPVFLKDAGGHLIYKYRDGSSGRGNEIYVAYDSASDTFRHLLATPLVNGEDKYNAYFKGPVLGPDGWFHLAWVWRDTPDAATNHDLSYARSRDLLSWERADGTELALPITLGTAEVVDPVPVGAGMINNNTVIGFDAEARPIVTYHKFGPDGNTQVYLARATEAGWQVVQATDWTDFRWEFGGGGSLVFRLHVMGARAEGDHLVVPVIRDGQAIDLIVDPQTLKAVDQRPSESLADRLADVVTAPEGLEIQTSADTTSDRDDPYALIWATRPTNRDNPRMDISAPAVLRLAAPVE